MSESNQEFQAGRRINTQSMEQNEPELAPAKIIEHGQSDYQEDNDEALEPEIDLAPVYKKSNGKRSKTFLLLVL